MQTTSTRTVVTLVLAGALVLTAGCSGIGLGEGDVGASSTEGTAENVTDDRTEATATESESASDDGHSHGGDDAGDGSDTDDGADSGDDAEPAPDDAALAELSGKMTVAVDGSELDLRARDETGDAFGVAESDEHTWSANETDLTLAAALSRLDVNATESALAVDGERYTESTEGTRVSYRVDGESVDPEVYVLEDADMVWITVTTAETNVSGPGTYIKAAQQHAHGEMTVVVEGEEVDFSKEKYQANHRHFHYEHGGGELWHAHSTTLTLSYALTTLEGINAEDDLIEYAGTTYDPADDGTTVEVTVNDEPVEMNEYVLKDGDSVRIVVESTG
jgi:sulfur carrier protein ThiS